MWNWPWKGSCLEGAASVVKETTRLSLWTIRGAFFLFISLHLLFQIRRPISSDRPQVSCYSRLCAKLTLFIGRDFISQCALLFRNHFVWSHWWKRLNHFMVHECATMPLKPRPSPNSLGSAQRGTPLLFQGIWFHRGCWELEWVICKELTLQIDLLIIMHDGSCERLLLQTKQFVFCVWFFTTLWMMSSERISVQILVLGIEGSSYSVLKSHSVSTCIQLNKDKKLGVGID